MTEPTDDKATVIVQWYQQQLANAQLQVAQLTAEIASLKQNDETVQPEGRADG